MTAIKIKDNNVNKLADGQPAAATKSTAGTISPGEKTADWVKAKENAREKILAAGHTARSLDHLIELARVEYNKKPFGSNNTSNNGSSPKGKEEEEKEEIWELKKVMTVDEIKRANPIMCNTCPNVACSVYQSTLDTNCTDAWFTCVDCQES